MAAGSGQTSQHAATKTHPTTSDDPFDEILGLEDEYYDQGFKQGLADGSSAGREEGLFFGIRSGTAKARELGKVRGRLCVWQQRVRSGALGEHRTLMRQLEELEGIVKENHTDNTAEEVERLEEQVRRAVRKVDMIARLLDEKGVGRARAAMPVDFTGAL